MTAKGKVNASKVSTDDRILIKVWDITREADRPNVEFVNSLHGTNETRFIGPSKNKTGEGVVAVKVLAKLKCTNRRGYEIQTSEGSFYAEPIETMWLAPEDAAGIKRAWAEALELDKTYEAYPLADVETEIQAEVDALGLEPEDAAQEVQEALEVAELESLGLVDATASLGLVPMVSVPGLDPDIKVFFGPEHADAEPIEGPREDETYRLTFTRIGRNHAVPPLDVTVKAADWDLTAYRISQALEAYARKFLTSTWFEVTTDLENGRVWIDSGRYGEGHVKKV